MNEEELKNKCTERAKIFQQAMESCKSSNPIDCIEWFADRIADLEKENAELKSGCGMCYRKDKEQLTKAKEIIRTFLGFAEAFGYSPSMDKFITEAEQFISEVEK